LTLEPPFFLPPKARRSLPAVFWQSRTFPPERRETLPFSLTCPLGVPNYEGTSGPIFPLLFVCRASPSRFEIAGTKIVPSPVESGPVEPWAGSSDRLSFAQAAYVSSLVLPPPPFLFKHVRYGGTVFLPPLFFPPSWRFLSFPPPVVFFSPQTLLFRFQGRYFLRQASVSIFLLFFFPPLSEALAPAGHRRFFPPFCWASQNRRNLSPRRPRVVSFYDFPPPFSFQFPVKPRGAEIALEGSCHLFKGPVNLRV